MSRLAERAALQMLDRIKFEKSRYERKWFMQPDFIVMHEFDYNTLLSNHKKNIGKTTGEKVFDLHIYRTEDISVGTFNMGVYNNRF